MDRTQAKKKLERLLAWMAQRIIRKYRPDIVAITGSVGKTGTKDAIFSVLAGSFGVRKSEGNLNNELGLPLSILGASSGGRSPFAWLRVLSKGFGLVVRSRPFPEILILEMGADHPGDLEKLTTIARPRVSVTTALAPVHTEFFPNLEALAEEKSTLARKTEADGYVVLNADDPIVATFASKTEARTLTYGFSPSAAVRAKDVHLVFSRGESGKRSWPRGTAFQLHYDGRSIEVVLNGALGKPAVTAALAGASLGIIYGLELSAIAESLGHYQPPKGRLRPIPGMNSSLLVDDSYNASPRAAVAALDLLAELAKELPPSDGGHLKRKGRRIAVFGNMSELGSFTESGHREVGQRAARTCDLLVTVGDLARQIAEAGLEAGLRSGQVASFDDQASALHLLRQEIDEDDIVLVKGSQSARMEKITAALLADPSQASKLLVRQGSEWVGAA